MDVETADDSIPENQSLNTNTNTNTTKVDADTPRSSLPKPASLKEQLKIVTSVVDVSSCASTPSAPTTPNPMNLSADKAHAQHNTSGSSLNTHNTSSSALNTSNPSAHGIAASHAHNSHLAQHQQRGSCSSSGQFIGM